MQIDLNKIKLAEATLQEYTVALISAESDSAKENAFIEFFKGTERTTHDSEVISEYDHRKLQNVWKEFFESHSFIKEKEISFGYLSQLPPILMDIENEPGSYIKGYKRAVIFFSKKDSEEKLIVEVDQNHDGTYIYTFNVTDKTKNYFTLLKKLADEKNLYKGQKIDCSCRFLKLDKISWDDVILSDGIEKTIKSNVNDLFSMREMLKKFNIPIKRGVILYGPPGTGKTQICRCLAKDAVHSVLYALPTDFSPNRGGVRNVCKMAKDLAPCLLIIEDIDWIAQDRHSGNAGFVMELMNQLDGLESFGDIITLGTTNCLQDLEEAVKNRPGRFDRLIKIGSPDIKSRQRMIERFTHNYILSKDIDTAVLAKSLNKLTGAHLKDLCITAAMFAVKDSSIENDKLLLKKKHFQEAIKEIKHKDYSSYSDIQGKAQNVGFAPGSVDSFDEFLEDDSLL